MYTVYVEFNSETLYANGKKGIHRRNGQKLRQTTKIIYAFMVENGEHLYANMQYVHLYPATLAIAVIINGLL